MCGICGMVGPDRPLRVSGLATASPPGTAGMPWPDGWRAGASDRTHRLRTMLDRMAHRGPDEEGQWLSGGAALAMKRLSILDLAHGHQPVSTPDGRVTAIINGEIYNWKELREWLVARGHPLHTRCDSEVVPYLYAELGDAMLNRLRGMFALAVWDSASGRLLLARDRLGEKPLYYAQDGPRLAFASEIKCLLGTAVAHPEMDPEALDLYLALLYVPAPRTMFRGIRKLGPGECLVWQGGRTEVRTWWDLHPPDVYMDREGEVVEATRAALDDAVRATRQADVPVGVFLSGGLDSTLVAGLMARQGGEPLRAFTIGYPQAAAYDETAFARQAAAHFGLAWRQVDFGPTDLLRGLGDAVWHLDEPLANVSSVMNLALARAAAREVKVVLTGTGGDEAFLGYPRYLGLLAARYWRRLPQAARRAAAALASLLPEATAGGARTLLRVKKFLAGDFESPLGAIVGWRSYMGVRARRALVAPAWRIGGAGLPAAAGAAAGDLAAETFAGLLEAWRGASWIEQSAYLDLKTYLPGYLLEHNDKMTMAAGLEARSPLLDWPLVDLAARAAPDLRLRRMHTKYVLKRAAEGVVPRRLIRRKKVGFNNPAALWFKGPLREALARLLGRDSVRRTGVFEPEAVGRLVEEHLAGRANHEYRLWAVLNLELWHRTFIQHRSFDGPAPLEGLVAAQGVTVIPGMRQSSVIPSAARNLAVRKAERQRPRQDSSTRFARLE